MEFLILLLSVMMYFWVAIPLLKKRIGYRRPKVTTIFYDYKTKWQFWYELGVIALTFILTTFLTPYMGIYTVLFVPAAFVAILVMRGRLEHLYHPQEKYHVISYVHAVAISIAFGAVTLYGLINS